MNILITGGSGFLGSNLAEYFSVRGHRVIGMGRRELSTFDQARLGYSKWITGSLSLQIFEDLNELPDVILHCAGGSSVTKSLLDFNKDYDDTVKGTELVLEFIKNKCPRARLIYPSSPAINGSCLNEPISVGAPVNPVSPYGDNKLRAEILCEFYKEKYLLDVFIIRLFSVYGPGLKKQLLWDACEKFKMKNPEFWGNGKETRDFVHIDDVSNLFLLVASSKNMMLPHKMNCGGGEPTEIFYILDFIKNMFDSELKLAFNGITRLGDPRYYWSDNTEAYQYGWQPKTNFNLGMQQYVAWYKKWV